jgi:hypothetical protein
MLKFFGCKNKIMFTGLVTVFSFSAQAQESGGGLFIEPAVTYEMGTTATNYPAPLSDSSGKLDGLGLGARFGFHLNEAFFLGLDGRYAMPQFKDSNVQYDAKAVSTSYGPVVGFQMPNLGMRVWGTYILGGELNPEASGNFDVSYKNLSGHRIGAGFRIQSFSVNLEYQQAKYTSATLEQVGPFASNSVFNNVTLENKAWIASLSFPLEL